MPRLAVVTAAALAAVVLPLAVPAGADPLQNPPAPVARHPDFTADGLCSGGLQTVDNTEPCLDDVLQAIDNARQAEGLTTPMTLPTGFAGMPAEEQLLVVVDLERVDRGLPPFAGSVPELTANAVTGANNASDPSIGQPSFAGNGWSATGVYSGETVNALAADYFWLYFDGWGGTVGPPATENMDCSGPTTPGCWGHRDAILGTYNGAPNLSLGAAEATGSNGRQAWAIEMVGTAGKPGAFTYSWASIMAGGGGGGGTTCGTAPTPTGKVARVAGDARDTTAILASRQSFPQSGTAKAVVVASDANFPDALAGGPLAAAKGGPLLITGPAGLGAPTEAEVKRVLPAGGPVYVLGGSFALSPTVATALQNDGYQVTSIAGPDRFATAVLIADALGDPTTVFEATGTTFPDALAAGPAAIAKQAAILLTNGSVNSAPTIGYLNAHPGTRYAIGGPAAAADPNATAVVGPDRFATAVQVTSTFIKSPTFLGFATGNDFPDALAGGPVVGNSHGGLVLLPKCPGLPPVITGYLQSVSATVQSGVLFGGSFAVSDDTLTAVDQALSGA